jgi:hypothetical protein
MAIKKVTLPDGSSVVIDEWLHYPLFSTIQLGTSGGAGDAVNLRAFSYVQGQRVPSTTNAPNNTRLADARDTNMVKRGGMNYDEAFILYALTFEHFALTSVAVGETDPITSLVAPIPVFTAENLRRLQRDVLVELIIGAQQQKPQLRAPMSYISQSVGTKSFAMQGNTAANTITGFSAGTAGDVDARNQRRLELPIYIESQQVSFLKVTSPVGTIAGMNQAVRLRWYWDGLKRRPVA